MKIIKEKKYSILATISKYSFIFVFIFALVMPIVFVGAITCPKGQIPNTEGNKCITAPAPGITIDTKIENPLGPKLTTLPTFIKEIIDNVLIVGIPLLVLAIIYAGFLFVKAQGNPEELKVAKNTLLYTIIGAALLLGAFVISNAIVSTVEEIKKGA